MISARLHDAPTGARPRLRLSVPSLSFPRLSSPLSSPRKEKQKIPSSGPGGLGNIRAAKSQQFETGSSTLLSSHPPSPSFSTKPASEPGSYGTSLYSVSTGVDKRASTCTTRSKVSSNRSTGCLVSDDGRVSDYAHDEMEMLSQLSSPTSSSFKNQVRESIFSTNSNNTFGVPRTPISIVSSGSKSAMQGRRSNASSQYARELVLDASVRAEEKRFHAANRNGSVQAGTKHPERLRSGRGGAGAYTKVDTDVDAGLFPTTAALTREHELRLAAQERQLLEASRARAAVVRRTGRGGAGNFSNNKGRRKQMEVGAAGADEKRMPTFIKKSSKGKEEKRQAESSIAAEEQVKYAGVVEHQHRGHRRSGSASSATGSVSRRQSLRTKSTVRVQRKGLGRLWSHVASVRTRGYAPKSNPPIEFEIVELKPDAENDDEASSPTSPGPVAIPCDMPIFGSTVANRAFTLARLEKRSRQTQLGDVLEEEAWVDEVGMDTRLVSANSKENQTVYSMTLHEVPHRKSTEHYASMTSISLAGNSSARGGTFSDQSVANGHDKYVPPHPQATMSRDSVGTFGPRRRTSAYEKFGASVDVSDSDDAESIVDPYMRGG